MKAFYIFFFIFLQLTMGANMQFNSYFPRYYNAGNLSLDGNGSSWPLNPDKKVSENGNSYNTAFLSADYLLAYNKELLKQTMLKHETVFKDQVNLFFLNLPFVFTRSVFSAYSRDFLIIRSELHKCILVC